MRPSRRPVGNTTADAAKAFPPASKWGYKEEAEVLTVEFGHGLGMPCPDPVYVPYAMPNINRQWSLNHPRPFEKGMVIGYESLRVSTGSAAFALSIWSW